MTKSEFDIICMGAVRQVRKRAPYDTGNLSNNGVRYEWTDKETFVIYVDENIAPYMKYTNESWDLFQPPLHGKKNKNEQWWQDATKIVAEYLTKRLKGKIK